jgi:hypothetical protein
MTHVSQPRLARGTMLPAGLLAAALFALLAFAPVASAAPDPLAGGTTTVTLKQGFVKSLKKKGVTIRKISPAKLKGKKATFPVTGGQLDPTTGVGTVLHSGGLKFKAGKRTAPVKALEINTGRKSLNAKVAGKRMKLATLAGLSFTRNGFGVILAVKKVKLTGAAAKRLNKKLGYTGKAPSPPFRGGRLIGSARSEPQPLTVTVLPGGNVTFTGNASTLAKLAKVQVKIETIPPTGSLAPGLYEFPIIGGTISPAGTAGVVQSSGGVRLVQELEAEPGKKLTTVITLGGFYVDLSARTATVEAVTQSNASPELNQGALGRTSVADLAVAGVVSNPQARTVAVSASATLQPIAASVLNAFVEVYKAAEPSPLIPDVSPESINAGDPLGTFSFTAQTQ